MTQKACVRREGRRPRGEANHAERMDSFHGQGRHVGLRSAPRVEPTRPAYLRRVVYAWPSCTTVCSSSNYAPQREWRKQREAPAGLQNFQRYKFTYASEPLVKSYAWFCQLGDHSCIILLLLVSVLAQERKTG